MNLHVTWAAVWERVNAKKNLGGPPNQKDSRKEDMTMANKLNVQFNTRQNKSLEDMADELGTTKAGVLKTALALLEVALREKRDGNSLGVIKGEKVVKEIIGIWLEFQ